MFASSALSAALPGDDNDDDDDQRVQFAFIRRIEIGARCHP